MMFNKLNAFYQVFIKGGKVIPHGSGNGWKIVNKLGKLVKNTIHK